MQSTESLRRIVSAAAPAGLSLEEPSPGYPVIRVNRPEASAAIALHGAHLLSWQPTGAQPVIYTSPGAIFREGVAIRGGIPLCWPWFGSHPGDSSKPSHGFARNRFWQLTQVVDDAAATHLIFALRPDRETREFYSHLFSLACTITIRATLQVSLRATNLSSEPITVGGALHTYFAVGDLSEVAIEGLDGIDYLDCVGERAVRTQKAPIHFGAEVDRIYRDAPVIRLLDRAWNRTITIENEGSKSTVVWNPWIEKAAALNDLPDDAFRDFVCIETANAGEDVIALAPEQSHSLTTRIRV